MSARHNNFCFNSERSFLGLKGLKRPRGGRIIKRKYTRGEEGERGGGREKRRLIIHELEGRRF